MVLAPLTGSAGAAHSLLGAGLLLRLIREFSTGYQWQSDRDTQLTVIISCLYRLHSSMAWARAKAMMPAFAAQ